MSSPFSATLLLLLGVLLIHLSAACAATTAPADVANSSGASTSPTAACRTSVYPKLCRAVLAPLPFPGNSYSFGQFSIKQALKQARRTSAMLDRLLSPGGTARSRRIGGAGALEDCRQLTRLNAGYLEEVESKLGGAGGLRTLSGTEADHVRALMSALVTNQQTCFDGLQQAAAASRSSSPSPLTSSSEVFAPLVSCSSLLLRASCSDRWRAGSAGRCNRFPL